MKSTPLIIGAGVIGLSLGWQLARSGYEVEIFEQGKAGQGASWVAAGMLAPRTEAGFEDPELLQLNLESLKQYPGFLKELEADSGKSVPIQTKGTLIAALDLDDLEWLRTFFDFRKKLGLSIQWLSGTEAREKEPLLSPHVTAAALIPDDLRVDPRQLLSALTPAFRNRGGKLHEESKVEKILVENEKVTGVLVNRKMIESNLVVVAAGSWSSQIPGIPQEFSPPVRPVKGQIITLGMNSDSQPTYILRSPKLYLVPGNENELLAGATSEEMGYDQSPKAGPLLDLLEEAFRLVPAIYEGTVKEIKVGLRPAGRDHRPILGKTDLEGLYYATGHYRHGILLAPITAYALCDLIRTGSCSLSTAFQPSRFQATKV